MKTLSLRVLVVDDDQPYSILLKKSLSGHGHSVVVCNSADDAFHWLQKEQVDIVLVDYNMGCSSGINILQWMQDKKIDIPVILITGYRSEEIYDEPYQWGASEYFVKGEMDNIRIPVMVEQVFSKHQARETKLK
jgi:two-component system response regulator HydG